MKLKFRKPQHQIIRILLTGVALLAIFLGVVGLMLPILPTTPFLLLAAFILMHSNAKVYGWLMNHSLWGQYLSNYTSGKGIPLKVKMWSITFLWLTIAVSVLFFLEIWWLELFLFIIACTITLHILSIRTFKKHHEQDQTPDK